MPSAHLSRSRDEVPGTVLRRRVSIKNPVASGDILANATSHSHAGETHGHRCPMLPFLPAGAWAPPPPSTTSCATSVRWPKWLNGHTAHPCVMRPMPCAQFGPENVCVWSCDRVSGAWTPLGSPAISHEFYGISPIY